MKKQIISFITASLILATPSLNAGIANWISNHLPASRQVSQEYRDEVKYMKHKVGIRTPIIFVNINRPSWHAAVSKICFWSYPPLFWIMFINEKRFNHETALGRTSINMQVLAHELEHIRNNDDGLCSQLEAVKQEARADKGSFAMLATLGYYKALEQQKKIYSRYGSYGYDRLRGEKYPTCREYIAWTEEALENCHGIDPNDRPDSENLMRNGNIRLELDLRNMKG
jgi:hypothetical protein